MNIFYINTFIQMEMFLTDPQNDIKLRARYDFTLSRFGIQKKNLYYYTNTTTNISI